MNVSTVDYIVFSLSTAALTIGVLKHLRQYNNFTGDIVQYSFKRMETSNMFQCKGYVVGQRDIQHLIDSKQIKAG